MERRYGFTLIETLVVLVISTLILSLSLLIAHNFNTNQFRNYLFWKEFHGEFELYERLARDHRTQVLIDFKASHHKVIFKSFDPKIHRHVINEPEDLSTSRSYKVRITDDGYVNPATVVWLINGRPALRQKFQLGWGMYTIDESEST